jgi:hypothetical protein
MAEITLPERLWQDFTTVAKRQRRKAETLAEEVLRDYLQRKADEVLLARSSALPGAAASVLQMRSALSASTGAPREPKSMTVRKKRVPVVIDTNVFIRSFMSRRNTNA